MLIRISLFIFLIYSGVASSSQYKEAIIDSANTFNISPCIIQAMLVSEGGKEGEDVHHLNGSIDIGVAQINKGGEWEKHFNAMGINTEVLRDNGSVAILALAYITYVEYSRSGDFIQAVSAYHRGYGRRNSISGYRYAQRVFNNFSILVNKGLCYD